MKTEVSTDASGVKPPTAQAFRGIAKYYDLLMRDIPYAEWKNYVFQLVTSVGGAERCRPGARILDVACGTGTYAILLAQLGYQVTGVDLSADMIHEATRKAAKLGLPVRFHVQDVAELNVEANYYDLCTCLFDSLNYITDASRLCEGFRRIHAALKPGGYLVFDLNTTLALRDRLFDQEDLRATSPIRYLWRSQFDEETRMCTVTMDFWVREGDCCHHLREVHRQRAYEDAEVQDLLQKAGFAHVQSYEAYSFRRPTRRTDRVFYVARKDLP